MIKRKIFFADSRAVIQGIGREQRYLIDGREVPHKQFNRFIKGKTLPDGRNRNDVLSKEARSNLYLEEMEYILAETAGQVDRVDPMIRRVEELRAEIIADMPKRKKAKEEALKRKTDEALRMDEDIQLRKMYDELRLQVLEEKIKLLEEGKAVKLAKKKFKKENYTSPGLRS